MLAESQSLRSLSTPRSHAHARVPRDVNAAVWADITDLPHKHDSYTS